MCIQNELEKKSFSWAVPNDVYSQRIWAEAEIVVQCNW